ncbi:hypothetical protein PR202_ga24942 [Eleusine coracana subsp. coracana]|uniref:Late embryogenesis abundant protein LEA-2 subgroup domain-containing protein n=1 Tax=Eleusine coracana subsp. coracana TaxID=191504 RepID=A0AAV5DA90_ELECO|nr:hypothetical protein QOZ80_9AG0672730 [Eleusine coracana subsp. coracana]GJN07140.1 hypothetical protein PR202_ga24942 [Eleusine coracana subsp. coracana]
MASSNGSVLPTHTASAPTWPSSKPPPPPPTRRRLCICGLVTLAILTALAITILTLSLTLFRVRDPTTHLQSTRLTGVAPRVVTLPTPSIQLNVTLLLTVAVHNPNAASFSYLSGHTDLTYRGAHVGSAEIDPGRIPSRGDGEVTLALTVQADRILAGDLGQLVDDVVGTGAMPLEANTRIPGKVSILGGIIKRRAVAYSDCKFVFGVAEMKVRSQECQDRTKL